MSTTQDLAEPDVQQPRDLTVSAELELKPAYISPQFESRRSWPLRVLIESSHGSTLSSEVERSQWLLILEVLASIVSFWGS